MSFRFLRPDSNSVWNNTEIKQRFSRYRSIIHNNSFSRYIIAKSLQCDFDSDNQLDALEELHKEKSEQFKELLALDNSQLKKRATFDSNYLTLNHKIAEKYLEDCIFCERKCKINRIDGKKGFCLVSEKTFLASAFLHYGEESVLVPSGTIFFQGCNFGCVFCQNYDISQSWKDIKDISETARSINGRELSEVADRLASKGALNINYVGGDPIPNIHTIIENLLYQKNNICQLWNSNFYLSNESLSLLVDLMDFWLPDFKYGNNECGKKYSNINNYYDILTRNLKRIHDDGSGEIIIRHLVMPNHIECCSKPILDFIANEIPKCVVNIMGQYRPEYQAHNFDEINRRPSSDELVEVKNYADQLGIVWKPVS
ncbi:MAG: radical SAM protein [Candidatus Lokiarchaeota archaeon]|nr:radical SAM protein [Candidatus Lokiarchaeota archaeon]MBD3199425.1 radical SAM protein [Candidatus Lokiarchaeota archaeon]